MGIHNDILDLNGLKKYKLNCGIREKANKNTNGSKQTPFKYVLTKKKNLINLKRKNFIKIHVFFKKKLIR